MITFYLLLATFHSREAALLASPIGDLEANTLLQVIGILVLLGTAALIGINIAIGVRKLRQPPIPQPFPISKTDPLATKSELKSVEDRIASEIAAIHADIKAAAKDNEERSSDIHKRIDSVDRAAAASQALIESLEKYVRELITNSMSGKPRRAG